MSDNGARENGWYFTRITSVGFPEWAPALWREGVWIGRNEHYRADEIEVGPRLISPTESETGGSNLTKLLDRLAQQFRRSGDFDTELFSAAYREAEKLTGGSR